MRIDRDTSCRTIDAAWSFEQIPEASGTDCEAPPIRDLSSRRKLAVAVHHAAIVLRNEDRCTLRFADQTVSRAVESTRRYYVLENAGADTAKAFADQVNR